MSWLIRSRGFWAVLLLGVAAAGWSHRQLLAAALQSNPSAGRNDSVVRGAALWQLRCQPCHGAEGRGDGPAAPGLRKKPKDLTRIALPPVFPDGIVAYRIAEGGEVMPAWKVVLNEGEIWDLVNFIRSQRRE